MTMPKHNPTPATMRLFVGFGARTVALMVGDPDDTRQPRNRVVALPRDPAARWDDPNVRLLRDMVRRQDAHDDLVRALHAFMAASRETEPTALASRVDVARQNAEAILAKAGIDLGPQSPADAH